MTFWIVLGVVCGWGESVSRRRGHRAASSRSRPRCHHRGRVSVPFQVVQQRADFNLDHRGVGLSPWQNAVDGVRYRLAARRARVHPVGHAQMITMPVRSAAARPPLRVHMSLDGRPADIVSVEPDRWQPLRLQVPQGRAPRFRRLEIRVEDAPADSAPILMIGKIEPR